MGLSIPLDNLRLFGEEKDQTSTDSALYSITEWG